MRVYEGMFVTKVVFLKEDEEQLLGQIEENITKQGGKILEKQSLGKRKLSYTIQKQTEGGYTRFLFEIEPSSVRILERIYRLQDGILRFGIFLCEQKQRGKK
ncbi:30S ribosomal protein S6 [bacterium Unc6]|nr:30S ribosomal protein S6 [bacterium Unc6]